MNDAKENGMVVAVKYCGGCNCGYDRGAMVESLRREFPAAAFTNAESQDGIHPDLVLVVCGCSSACAAHEHLTGRRGKMIAASAADFEAIRERLRELTANPDAARDGD